MQVDATWCKGFIQGRNYNVGPLSLPHKRNWSLKFQASTISPLSFKIELYWSFY